MTHVGNVGTKVGVPEVCGSHPIITQITAR